MQHNDIKIVLIFSKQDEEVRELIHTLDDLESVLYQTSRKIIENIFSKLNTPHPYYLDTKLLKDACLERIRRYRGQRLRLHRVHEGSLVFELLVTGVAFWIVKITIAESATTAWKSSETHKRLSKYFKESIDGLASQILLYLRTSERRISKSDTKLIISESGSDEPDTIRIIVPPRERKEKERVPLLSEVIEEGKKLE